MVRRDGELSPVSAPLLRWTKIEATPPRKGTTAESRRMPPVTQCLRCEIGPFVIRLEEKPDGRWSWQVFAGTTTSAQASGVVASLGAAKTVTEQYVKRSGLL